MAVSQPSSQPKRSVIELIGDFIKRNWRAYTFLFTVAAIIIALDQWTKELVRNNIALGTDWLPAKLAWLLPYARVRYWYNSGAAFGFFQNGNLVFTILAIIVIALIIYFYPRTVHEGWYLRLAKGRARQASRAPSRSSRRFGARSPSR